MLPGFTTNLPDVSRMNEQAAARIQRDRIQRILQAWEYYEGCHRKPLKVDAGRPDDNTIINRCRLIVDAGVSFLFGQGVEFDVCHPDDRESAKAEAADEWLEAVWDANHGAILQHNLAMNGAVSGDVFLRVRMDPGSQYPRIINLDPATIYALWDVDDFEKVLQYVIEWQGVDPLSGKMRARRQTISRSTTGPYWDIVDYMAEGNNRYVEIGREVWQYTWCPVFHCQNLPSPNEFYGTPDLTPDLIHINDRITFTASNNARILRLHAHPKTWGRGFMADQMSMAPDEVTVIADPAGLLQNLEMTSDLGSSMTWYDKMTDAMFEAARVPMIALGKLDGIGSAPSGVALQIEYTPIVQKTQTKQMLYGELFADLNKRLLELGGFGDWEVETEWPEMLPQDPAGEAATAVIYKELGVSTETVLDRLGFDPAKEAALNAAAQEADAAIGDRMLAAFEKGQTQQQRMMQGGQQMPPAQMPMEPAE